ncbi:MAG: hypothetical protein ACR2GP_10715 [Burkholderiaceae bacterium]
MFGLWSAASLSLTLRNGHIYLFSSLGLFLGVNRLLALLFIRIRPSLGAVG